MVDAVEPWVSDEMHSKQLLAYAQALHQEHVHHMQLQRAVVTQSSSQAHPPEQSRVHHNTVNRQHVDVDV